MTLVSKFLRPRAVNDVSAIRVSPLLMEVARLPVQNTLEKLQSDRQGLSEEQVELRLKQYGPNVIAEEKHHSRLGLLGRAMLNPLVVLLLVLATVSLLTGDLRAALVMAAMVVLGEGNHKTDQRRGKPTNKLRRY